VNNTAGVTHVIEKGTSGAMAIPEFSIDPGTYPIWLSLVISLELSTHLQLLIVLLVLALVLEQLVGHLLLVQVLIH